MHEAAVVNQTTAPDANGNSGHVQIGYASAQNTSGNGQVGFNTAVGATNMTVNTGAGSNVKGQVNVQSFTADANGHASWTGAGIGANARVVQWGGQLSVKIGSYTVTTTGTVSAIGFGGQAHLDVNHGFSAGAGLILGVVGASLNISVNRGN
jgi:hypothetical protein